MEAGEDARLVQFRQRMHEAYSYWREPFEFAEEDVRFSYIEQWDQATKAARAKMDRPSLEINPIPQYINQVVGVARKSKYSIHISQKTGSNLPANRKDGSKYSNAEIMEGLVRDIESRCNAHEHYCRALQHAVEGGFGWLFVRTEIPPDDPFNVEVIIEHITDRWSVLFDPYAEKDDLRDADWVCITHKMKQGEFNARYENNRSFTSPVGIFSNPGFDANFKSWWSGKDEVRLCRYFYKKPVTRTAYRFLHTETREELVLYEDQHKEIFDELMDGGYQLAEEPKEVKTYKICTMLCVADEVLEEEADWPGMHLPVVIVSGRKVDFQGRRMYNSLVRYAHDPSRMGCHWLSAMTERVANSPKTPMLITANQIRGHEEQWKRMQTENLPYLVYNADEENPSPPARQPGATMPVAEAQMVQFAEKALRGAMGMHEANLGERTAEISGIAIQRKQDAGNNSVYEFIDNLATSVRNVGEVVCDLIQKIYTNEQARRIVLPDESATSVKLNYSLTDEGTGRMHMVNNISLCRYDCSVSSGPGFSTQREEFVNLMMEWGRTDPEGIANIRDLIARNLDIPNSRQVAMRLLKMVPKQLLEPEEVEMMGEQPEMPPSPEEQASMAESKAKMAMAEGMQAKSELEVQKAQVELQTASYKAGAEQAKTDMQGKEGGGNMDEEMIRRVVKGVIAEEKAGKK